MIYMQNRRTEIAHLSPLNYVMVTIRSVLVVDLKKKKKLGML